MALCVNGVQITGERVCETSEVCCRELQKLYRLRIKEIPGLNDKFRLICRLKNSTRTIFCSALIQFTDMPTWKAAPKEVPNPKSLLSTKVIWTATHPSQTSASQANLTSFLSFHPPWQKPLQLQPLCGHPQKCRQYSHC